MSAETVEGLEQIIGKLETKHAELIKRNTELTTVRASVAYKALSEDDAKARATLDRVNRDSIEHSAELASVEAALATARGKLAAAEQREANIVRLEQAQAIRREWAEVGVDFDTVDKHLAAAVEAFGNIYGRYDRMQQLGFKPPPQKELMLCDGVTARPVAAA